MRHLVIVLSVLFIACTNSNKRAEEGAINDSLYVVPDEKKIYKSTSFVDSFINAHKSQIERNNALRQQYEEQCTVLILPKIKKGLYDDLPFVLKHTELSDGKAYGNFVYNDGVHYLKVQCLMSMPQMEKLKENNTYLITIDPYDFETGVIFNTGLSSIELPTTLARLKTFKEHNITTQF